MPPYLLDALVAALVPALVYMLVRPRRGDYSLVVGPIFTIVPTVWSLLAPSWWALPAASWAVGITALALLIRKVYEWSQDDGGPLGPLTRLGSTRWELPSVCALILGLALVMTWPLVLRLGTDMPGWPMDNFAFLYKLWWFRTALVVQHTSPLFDPNSYAPFGFDLGQGEPTLANTIPALLQARSSTM